MTVYVVYSEFNRGYDTDGSAVVEGVYATAQAADEAADVAREGYREMGTPVYGDEDSGADWGVDVHVEAFPVEGTPA